ncbi:DUF2065 domain-containing protein [Amaricoccus macauensis]|uniref:DUF2065 domain-containing protein n=1 Tax=Amaricoccus macauensis TaxID=57001 RepID=UPI003C7AC86A
MIRDVLMAFGLVAIFEGLALALAPARVRDMLEMLDSLSIGQRRTIALAAIAFGTGIVWIFR